MAKTFQQVFFKPGRYHVGGGRFRDITSKDVADYVRGTQELLGYGHRVPLLYEHAPAGSDEGAPVQLSTLAQSKRDKAADQVKHGAGWLNRVWLNEQGEAAHELEVTDSEAAKKLKDGSIKFTSPELRESFIDGKGRTFNRIISHMALTHRPRNTEQSPIEETPEAQAVGASQFSLSDWEQFSGEMDEENGDATTPADESTDNPDLPKDNSPAQDEQQFQAVLELLKDHAGVDLPADTTMETFVPYLLTGLKTLAAVKEKQAQEDAAKDGDDDDPESQVVEEKPPMQFSLADVTEGKVENKLLAAVMRNGHSALMDRINARQKDCTLPPAVAKALADKAATMQFSEEGDEQIMLSLSEVVGMLEDGMPKGGFASWTTDQFSAATEEGAPENLKTPDGDITPEQARAMVDKQSRDIPYIRKNK